MKEYLEVGKIVSTHGVVGELKVYPWADSPEQLRGVPRFFLDDAGERPLEVVSARVHKNMLLLKLRGITSIEQARSYMERTLYAHRDHLALEEGAHFVVDLIGLRVLHAETGEQLGVLEDVTSTGRQDLYHVRTQKGELRMVPVVPAFVKEVCPEQGYVTILPIKGLLQDED